MIGGRVFRAAGRRRCRLVLGGGGVSRQVCGGELLHHGGESQLPPRVCDWVNDQLTNHRFPFPDTCRPPARVLHAPMSTQRHKGPSAGTCGSGRPVRHDGNFRFQVGLQRQRIIRPCVCGGCFRGCERTMSKAGEDWMDFKQPGEQKTHRTHFHTWGIFSAEGQTDAGDES